MKIKKVLIANDSTLITDLLKSFLQDEGWVVESSKDGIDTLKKLFEDQPDCLIVSTELPVINGYDLTHIVKAIDDLKNTAVIITSNEQGNDARFWSENSKSDAFYVPSADNLNTLTTLVEKTTERFSNRTRIQSKKMTETEIIALITSTFGEELYELYMTREVFNVENYVWDLEHLLSQMARSIGNIYNYDVLGIIVNEDKVDEYYDRSDSIAKSDFQDFRNICQTDFIKRISSRKDFNWLNSNFSETVIEQFNPKKEKLRNYNIFPVDTTKKYPFTIHVATSGNNPMSTTIQKRLDFLTDIYAPVFEKTITFNKSITSEMKIKNAFSRFLPPKVIERIVEGDTSVTSSVGEQRKVAILMADIRGFTAIAEINQPDKVVTFLNQYFSLMGNIIRKHGGTIDKFMGDEIMALFGVPESYKYNGYRAANAAAEMLKEIEKIDTSSLLIPDNLPFKVGIGIHYGLPIAGTIGSEDKKEYTVIGDDVNLASRIEDLTKLYGTSILITDAVKKDIESAEADMEFGRYLAKHESYNLRYLDNVKVKGKSIPVQIFELYNNKDKYSENFNENFSKGLYQYLVGNFNGAQDYLRIAKVLAPKDKATLVLLERCKKFIKQRPQNWDGAITLTTK
ncbi:adenylate/guanylate cyclase domain-containing protein [Treponema sp.]|uniref:adenylate/guanylate cyclase domain-containing protein n=1 Tax=Treponema sp. TaxID=166 RepID=UPI00388D9CF4